MWAGYAKAVVSRVVPPRCRVMTSARLLHGSIRRPSAAAAPRAAELIEPDRKVLEKLVCPFSKLPLTYDREARELVSPVGVAYPITASGIPNMVPACARLVAAQPDEEQGG
ncbi:unnamed protein product [Pylaiella littoralis]